MNKESQMSASGGMPIEQIALRSVDLEDFFFVITFAPDLSSLHASIARGGLLHPPILQPTISKGHYRVVSGYKRLLALQKLGADEVSACISTGEDDLSLFLMNLEENLGSRQLNVIEKALALDKLSRQFGLSREDILGKYLPRLELGSDPKTLDLYLSIAQLEDEIKRALASDRLSVAAAQQLTSLPLADRMTFIRLVEALRLGKSLQRELLVLLTDLARKEKTSFSEILAPVKVASAMKGKAAQAPLQARRVRQLLIERRYPRYSQAVERFEKLRERLQLPAHILLQAPPFFEGQSWRLVVTFRNREELEAARKALDALADNPLADELLHFSLQEPE
jgi:ParB/RepB/Spo0J family partition protein